jgi:acetylornithine/N-succinyldiaminopimelate aminotransferase
MRLEQLQALERDHVIGTYARNPVQFVRGDGTRLWDERGAEYLDFLSATAIPASCRPSSSRRRR